MRCQNKNTSKERKKSRWKNVGMQEQRIIARRTNSHLYLQIFSGCGSYTIQQSSSLSLSKKSGSQLKKSKANALLVGRSLAIRSLSVGVKKVSFDRLGFRYHGHIKMMAESARNYGLTF